MVFFLQVQRPDSLLRQVLVQALVALFEFVGLYQRVFFFVLGDLELVLERVYFLDVLPVPLPNRHFELVVAPLQTSFSLFYFLVQADEVLAGRLVLHAEILEFSVLPETARTFSVSSFL